MIRNLKTMKKPLQKIGIITHYYNSKNYGGNLQAYALSRYLSEMDYDAEQMCYIWGRRPANPSLKHLAKVIKKYSIYMICRKTALKGINLLFARKFRKRREIVQAFNQKDIPHGEIIYTKSNIQDSNRYAAYITGSDQVWNLDWYEPAFFLDFVPFGKPKIAYAASIGHAELSEEQAGLFRSSLRNYMAISVREKDAVDLVSLLSPVPVEWTLDPVLLLNREQWDEICSDRLVQVPYLFCYFLGTNKQARKLAAAYGKKKCLKVVFLPYIHGSFRKCDFGFGDIRLYEVSPKDFISLIKHADYVFTDSFHATAFSEIYRTPYAVFRRDGTDSMSSRIYSVTSIFESGERFCDTDEKETLDYIENLPPMEQDRAFPLLESMREKSYRFLTDSLSII